MRNLINRLDNRRSRKYPNSIIPNWEQSQSLFLFCRFQIIDIRIMNRRPYPVKRLTRLSTQKLMIGLPISRRSKMADVAMKLMPCDGSHLLVVVMLLLKCGYRHIRQEIVGIGVRLMEKMRWHR